MQMQGPAFGGYPAANRDYSSYYGGPVKRQRTSVDLGTRSIYDGDDRFARQMNAYPQGSNIYSNQPGAYQNPMIQGYTTGQTGVPDYAVRQPQPGSNAASSYGTPEDPMLAMRSPGTGYMAQQRYPAYNGAQIPYGLPSSAPVPQLADASSQNRANQQASMQSLVAGQAVNQSSTPVWGPLQANNP